jgi:RNA polymerase sigma-70 factor (ECF subfamily)
VIKSEIAGHEGDVLSSSAFDALPSPPKAVRLMGTSSPHHNEERFRALVESGSEFVWRSLRRLGVRPADLDDAMQEVFVVAARRLGDIESGRERAFLFGIAVRVASTRRRTLRRHPEDSDTGLAETFSDEPGPDELSELRQARPVLQRILDSMSDDCRAVFVLAELEQLSAREIADVLGIPQGTASSRLRSAREIFHAAVRRLAAQDAFPRRSR